MERSLDAIANNIANASTTAYRAQRSLFQEHLAKTGSIGNRDSISYTQDIGDYRDTRDGALNLTNNPLDLAIRGNGYFVVGAPGAQFYTRNGQFHVDDNRQIVTSEGYPVLQANGQPVVIPGSETEVNVTGDGTVSTRDGGPVGQLSLVRFGDDQNLRRGPNGFYVTDQAPLPTTAAAVIQGAVEGSNVQPIMELTAMMAAQRSYGNASKLIETESDRMRSAITRIAKQ
jgi:flagellar basal-body rod protein FlgF